MKVCFISSRSGWVKNDQQVRMDKANAMLIEALSAAQGHEVSLAITDVGEEKKSFDYTLGVTRIYPLPAPLSYAGGVRNTRKIYQVLRKVSRENDLLIIQLPFVGFIPLLGINRPAVYHVCANVLTAAANPVKYRGLKRLASGTFAWIMHRIYHILFSRSRVKVIVNGEELGRLYQKYKPQVVISSSLVQEDIVPGKIPATSGPIKLLFVGRPSLEKGFDTVIEALLEYPHDFTLSVVGFTQTDFEHMLPEMYERSVHIHHRIEFKGYRGWNNGLKEVIRECDIALIPSRSEGTPRVILECMSQGAAIVASRVGGIPTIVKDRDNGLLVEPGSAKDLQDKIFALSTDIERRKRLISGGFKTAQANTIDNFAGYFIQAIDTLKDE